MPRPDSTIAVRYAASERHMDIGGDFIDAVGLPDGRLAVVIGDVCGHGPSEAAYGTALRAAWRTIVLTHRPDPIEWVRRLDTTFFATDRHRRLRHAVHRDHRPPDPPRVARLGRAPLADRARGDDRHRRHARGAPLGLGPRGWTASDVSMGPRGLLLYTDGLIENPRGDGPADRWGEDGLVEWLQGRWPASDLGRLGDELMDAVLEGREQRDDVAVMLVSLTGPARTPAELDGGDPPDRAPARPGRTGRPGRGP